MSIQRETQGSHDIMENVATYDANSVICEKYMQKMGEDKTVSGGKR